MIDQMWSDNHPERFWQCQAAIDQNQWREAIARAIPMLGLPAAGGDLANVLAQILGEGQFGEKHWQLGAGRRLYYDLKPLLPQRFTRFMRSLYNPIARQNFPLGWPIEARYVWFQWEIMRQLLDITGKSALPFTHFWPDGYRFAFILTHDVETADGQAAVRELADIDESMGFRSCFNFVPERYPVDSDLLDELRERGFEIGVHGLKHDGRLFRSYAEFKRRAERINRYLKAWDAAGFRAPYTHRNPAWLQLLDIDYDLSFFDTDPYEPCPGGTMSIWPFFTGRFVEMPYTLVQDSTLTLILGEMTPHLWLKKVDFIERFAGMALVITHPDYLNQGVTQRVYVEFLSAMRDRRECWHTLPRDAARWWRRRSGAAELIQESVTPCLARFTAEGPVLEKAFAMAGWVERSPADALSSAQQPGDHPLVDSPRSPRSI